jgi:hypothetical protein
MLGKLQLLATDGDFGLAVLPAVTAPTDPGF